MTIDHALYQPAMPVAAQGIATGELLRGMFLTFARVPGAKRLPAPGREPELTGIARRRGQPAA